MNSPKVCDCGRTRPCNSPSCDNNNIRRGGLRLCVPMTMTDVRRKAAAAAAARVMIRILAAARDGIDIYQSLKK